MNRYFPTYRPPLEIALRPSMSLYCLYPRLFHSESSLPRRPAFRFVCVLSVFWVCFYLFRVFSFFDSLSRLVVVVTFEFSLRFNGSLPSIFPLFLFLIFILLCIYLYYSLKYNPSRIRRITPPLPRGTCSDARIPRASFHATIRNSSVPTFRI